jgi:hypothetical protein
VITAAEKHGAWRCTLFQFIGVKEIDFNFLGVIHKKILGVLMIYFSLFVC